MSTDPGGATTDALAFRMRDVFPADDLVAEWVATIAIAFNDLALIHDVLEKDAEAAEHRHRWLYWLRVAISHFGEAASYLADTAGIPEIAAAVDNLPQEARDNHAEVIRIYREHEAVIEQIRNTTAFHYTALKTGNRRGLVHKALEALADETVVIKRGTVRTGRMLFADDIIAQLFVRPTGAEGAETAHAAISSGIQAFMRFANPILTEHFERAGRAGAAFVEVVLGEDGTWRHVDSGADRV